jgi:hypothetical protein
VSQVCVNLYDLHDTQAAKPRDYIVGGSERNKDNSFESGVYDPASSNYCQQPSSGGTPVPAGGALGLTAIAGLTLAILTRRSRRNGRVGPQSA